MAIKLMTSSVGGVTRLFASSGALVAADTDCECPCVSPPPCPANCAGCPTTFTLTVAGFANGAAVHDQCCGFVAGLNGTFTLTRVGNFCLWFSSAFDLGQNEPPGFCVTRWDLYCADGVWVITPELSGPNPHYIHSISGACPPTGTYTISGAYDNCGTLPNPTVPVTVILS